MRLNNANVRSSDLLALAVRMVDGLKRSIETLADFVWDEMEEEEICIKLPFITGM